MQTVPTQSPPLSAQISFWQLFLIWASIGLRSFGGGASTIFLIQYEFIDKRHWMTIEEFTHFWNLCVLTPGINLVAVTILIGRKLGGAVGICSSLLGMLLPSASITCLIVVVFREIESIGAVQAVVRGVVPATAGIMFVVGLRFAQVQLRLAHKDGWLHIITCLGFILAVIVGIVIFDISIVILLPCTALLGLVIFTYVLKSKEEKLSK